MRLPLYTYYIAKPDISVDFIQGVKLNLNSGEFLTGSSTDFAAGLLPINNERKIYINDKFLGAESGIAFYDKNERIIESKNFEAISGQVISAPIEAIYFAVYVSSKEVFFEVSRPIIYIPYVVNPLYKNLIKVIEQESNEIFFREKLKGDLSFKAKSYELLKDLSLNTTCLFLIYEGQVTSGMASFNIDFNKDFSRELILEPGTLYYKGLFNKANCTFNYSKKTATIKSLTTDDNYAKILASLDNTYNLINLAPATSTLTLRRRPLIQVYIAGASTVTNLIAGTYWESEVTGIVNDEKELIDKYHFAKVKEYVELFFSNGEYGPFVVQDSTIKESAYKDLYEGYVLFKVANAKFSLELQVYTLGNRVDSWVIDTTILWQVRNQNGELIDTSDSTSYLTLVSTGFKLSLLLDNWRASGEHPQLIMGEGTLLSITYGLYRRVLLTKAINIQDAEGKKTAYPLGPDDFAVDSSNYKYCIDLTGGSYWATDYTINIPTKYGINDNGEYFTDDFIPGSTGLSNIRLVPISRSYWANISIWMEYSSLFTYSPTFESTQDFSTQLQENYKLKDSYYIIDVLRALLNRIDPAITIDTEHLTFLNRERENPIAKDAFGIYLVPRSNILKGNYDQPAQKVEITLSQILSILRACYNCYWSIDSSGNFIVEHKSYYTNGKSYEDKAVIGIDLTDKYDQFNKQEALYMQSEKNYDMTVLYSRLEMSFPAGSTELFGPLNVNPTAEYAVLQNIKSLSPDIATDVDYMFANPSAFSEDGLALICATQIDERNLVRLIEGQYKTETGKPYTAMVQNYFASWPYLLQFHLVDAPSRYLNCEEPIKDIREVKSLAPIELQAIEFPCQTDPDMYKLVKTELGLGRLKKCEINIDTRQCSVELELSRDE